MSFGQESHDTVFLSRDLLLRVSKPAQYLGGELNAIVKPWDKQQVKIALAFPDLYEIGMSHLGLKILYHLLNQLPGVAAERAFAPAKDMEAAMREHGIPLFSLENRKPLACFDLVGFSLQYELSYTNVLNMLDLAGIPVQKEKRRSGVREKGRNHFAAKTQESGSTESSASLPSSSSPLPRLLAPPVPLIFAGGPNAFNPEPMADFIDFFVIGDGEEVMIQIAETVRQLKEQKTEEPTDYFDYLRALAKLDGVYVPEFYRISYYSTGEIKAWEPLVPEAPAKVKKAVLPSLENVGYPHQFILPNIGIVHDRVPIEVRRGCSCGCRFCQAGYIYRPVRERSAAKVIQLCDAALKQTGYEEFSLLSLSTADYTPLAQVVPQLTKTYAKEGVSLSLPSLRLNKFNLELAQGVQEVRKSTLTFAPEAGTQRLRDVINKGITDKDLFDTMEMVFKAGWKGVKLYFMIGLPTETDDDVIGIAQLANKVFELGKTIRKKNDPQVSVTISTFVPKGFTPFQWAEQASPEEIRRRQQLIRSHIKYRNIHLKFNPILTSIVEGALSRGDRRLGPIIYDAWRYGATFDGWDESFDYNNWQKAFEKNRLDIYQYLRERNPEETMPWDIVEAGIQKEFLQEEWERAQKTQSVEDCAKVCYNCGISSTFKIDNLFANSESQKEKMEPKHKTDVHGKSSLPIFQNRSINSTSVQRLRFKFAKIGNMAFISHLDLFKVFERAFRRAELPVTYSMGFNPHPKLVFAAPLGLGIESVSEYCDLELYENIALDGLLEDLQDRFPGGIQLLALQEVPLNEPPLMAQVAYASYQYLLQQDHIPPLEIQATINDFLSQSQYIITRRHPTKGEKNFDILPFIASLRVEDWRLETQDQEPEGNERKIEKTILSVSRVPNPTLTRPSSLITLQALLRTGSNGGLRPEELISGLSAHSGIALKLLTVRRIALLDQAKKEFL